MPVNDILQASILYVAKGDKLANVLHFKRTSSDGALPQNEDLAAAIIEDLVPTLKACLSNDCTIQAISAKRISPTLGGSVLVDVSVAGTVAQDMVPPNSTALATLYSDHLTRTGRGRIFLPAVPDTFQTSGRINNGDAATYVAFLDKLKAQIQGGTGATFLPGVWSPTDGMLYPISSHTLRPRLTTLRSRRMANP